MLTCKGSSVTLSPEASQEHLSKEISCGGNKQQRWIPFLWGARRGQEAIKAGLRYRPVQTAALIIILLFDFLLAAVPALPFSTPLVHNLFQFADLTKKKKKKQVGCELPYIKLQLKKSKPFVSSSFLGLGGLDFLLVGDCSPTPTPDSCEVPRMPGWRTTTAVLDSLPHQPIPFPKPGEKRHWLQLLEQNDRVICGLEALHRLPIKLWKYLDVHNHHAFSNPTPQTYSQDLFLRICTSKQGKGEALQHADRPPRQQKGSLQKHLLQCHLVPFRPSDHCSSFARQHFMSNSQNFLNLRSKQLLKMTVFPDDFKAFSLWSSVSKI